MWVDFEAPAGYPRALRRIVLAAHLTGSLGVALLCVMFVRSGHAWFALACALACYAVLAISLRRSAGGVGAGLLFVSAVGAARWRPAGGHPEPLEPVRWLVLGGLAWLDGRTGEGRVRIMLGRHELGDRRWRLLLAWLRWMDRGGAPAASLGIPARRPKLG